MTTKPPLFSIITVTKNNVSGLGATYESILAQSFAEYEWIIVDGGSTDSTLLFLSKDGLLENCVSEPDAGIYDAMNKGIVRARGDYLLFLNAGDRLSDPDILSTLSKVISVENPDFIYGDALESHGLYKKARHHGAIAAGMITHHQAMLYRRTLIKDHRYDLSYKIAADYDFTLRFLQNTQKAHYIPAALCIFENGGISQKNAKLGRREEDDIRKKNSIGLPRRAIVSLRQNIAAAIKRTLPDLYRRLR